MNRRSRATSHTASASNSLNSVISAREAISSNSSKTSHEFRSGRGPSVTLRARLDGVKDGIHHRADTLGPKQRHMRRQPRAIRVEVFHIILDVDSYVDVGVELMDSPPSHQGWHSDASQSEAENRISFGR